MIVHDIWALNFIKLELDKTTLRVKSSNLKQIFCFLPPFFFILLKASATNSFDVTLSFSRLVPQHEIGRNDFFLAKRRNLSPNTVSINERHFSSSFFIVYTLEIPKQFCRNGFSLNKRDPVRIFTQKKTRPSKNLSYANASMYGFL